jgi:hypothetical protein
MDVSVWLSLLLVVADKQAQELILEPATQEDIEGTLDEFEPGRVTGEVRLGQAKLVVQARDMQMRCPWNPLMPKPPCFMGHPESECARPIRLEDRFQPERGILLCRPAIWEIVLGG